MHASTAIHAHQKKRARNFLFLFFLTTIDTHLISRNPVILFSPVSKLIIHSHRRQAENETNIQKRAIFNFLFYNEFYEFPPSDSVWLSIPPFQNREDCYTYIYTSPRLNSVLSFTTFPNVFGRHFA